MDLLVHTWDLARAARRSPPLPTLPSGYPRRYALKVPAGLPPIAGLRATSDVPRCVRVWCLAVVAVAWRCVRSGPSWLLGVTFGDC